MKIDVTMPLTRQMLEDADKLADDALVGHLGTHYDVMEEEFPLEYTERCGVIFDVSTLGDRDVAIADIDESKIAGGCFVIFYTGYSKEHEYGERGYFTEHPQLSRELVSLLINRGVSLIGIDCAGIRRPPDHVPTDDMCARHGTFVIENLRNLKALLNISGEITMHTYPLNAVGVTGIPCRVIAEVREKEMTRI